MAIYNVISKANGLALNIYGNSQVSENRNVCLWTANSSTAEQQWSIATLSGNTRILSNLNTAYGLNVWTGSTNKNNCDIHTVNGNSYDSLIKVAFSDGHYAIKLANYNLYLTAKGNNAGDDVRWEAPAASSYQQWNIQPLGGTTPTSEISYPTDSRNVSQSYSNSHSGIDIPGNGGAIRALANGTVSYVQNSAKSWRPGEDTPSDNESSMSSMGNMIAINYNNPDKSISSSNYLRTIYMHMKSSASVSAGQHVTKGQVVGYIGNTGRSTGPHLHLTLCAGSLGSMKPGTLGWVSIGSLPTINPEIYLPEYN